jgi:hypothetical protein
LAGHIAAAEVHGSCGCTGRFHDSLIGTLQAKL